MSSQSDVELPSSSEEGSSANSSSTFRLALASSSKMHLFGYQTTVQRGFHRLSGLVERVTAGKLRLCIQASIRHNDLLSTPLNMIEWCRFMGTKNAAGVRARSPRTKSGVRPWVASFLGVCPAGDCWLETTIELILQSHGSVVVHQIKRIVFPATQPLWEQTLRC